MSGQGLFGTDGFSPRALCGPAWTEWLVVLHMVSDIIIFFSYVAIPTVFVLLYRLYSARDSMPTLRASDIICLTTFVATCGATHALDAAMFFWPAYRFSGVILASCAVSSVASFAVFMLRLVKEINGYAGD